MFTFGNTPSVDLRDAQCVVDAHSKQVDRLVPGKTQGAGTVGDDGWIALDESYATQTTTPVAHQHLCQASRAHAVRTRKGDEIHSSEAYWTRIVSHTKSHYLVRDCTNAKEKMPATKRRVPARPTKIVRARTSDTQSTAVEVPQFSGLGTAPTASIVTPPSPSASPVSDHPPRQPLPPSILFGTRRRVTPSTFPASLKILNPNTWVALSSHLDKTPHVPVFVHGPTGCGKTRGVHQLITHMGMRPVYLDAVEADDTTQLVTWIRRTREARTLKRQSVIILDDMEGFTPNARAELAKLAADQRSELNPMVMICNARRDLMWKAFPKRIAEVRLFAPNEHTLLRWFSTCYQWTSHHDKVERVGVSEAVLRSHCSSLIKHGDIRRIVTALETCNRLGTNLSVGHDIHVSNTFDASRRLLRGCMAPELWTTLTEPRDSALIQYHATSLATADTCDELANLLETFSACDTMLPARFELTDAQFPMKHFIEASAVTTQLPTRSLDVGALFPPPRLPRSTRLAEETQWSSLRSIGRS